MSRREHNKKAHARWGLLSRETDLARAKGPQAAKCWRMGAGVARRGQSGPSQSGKILRRKGIGRRVRSQSVLSEGLRRVTFLCMPATYR